MQTPIFSIDLTKHGAIRMQQRGFKNEDINIIAQCGTDIGDHEVFMRSKDVDREILYLKKMIKKIDRLRNRKIVIAGNSLVTCYSCNSNEVKRLRRLASQKG